LTVFLYAAVVVAAMALLLLLAGQAGWLSGRAPSDLGVRDGRLKAPSPTPNSVSSQADLHVSSDALVEYARIAPLAAADTAATMARLRGIVEARPDYLYVQFTTRWLQFVDDAEFWASPAEGVVHVRSASRLGRRDFGVNRARIERIRAALSAAATR